jgi:septal ring factor EnvC (AmiA/AmiB activator)
VKRKTGIILLAVVLLLISGVLPVFANQINNKQEELNAVRGDLKQQKKELQQNKAEQQRVEKQIKLLKGEINTIEAELRSLAKKIDSTESEITKTEAELAAAQERIDKMDSVLAVRLRTIYEKGKVSYLDVLFSSSSFTEFLTRYNNLQLIISEDKQLLTEFQAERVAIAAAKELLEERRQELETMRRENLSQKSKVEKKRTEQRQLAVALQEAYEEVENSVKQLEAEAKTLEKIIRDLQAAQRGSASRGTGEMIWPVEEYGPSWVTSPYGYRRNPFTGASGSWHGGVDIGIPHSRWPKSRSYSGSPARVVAADSGIAYTYPSLGGYGNLVIVDHGGGIATAYAHLHSFRVTNKAVVLRGDVIGYVGSTGASTGPHLHFEVRKNGNRVNPMPFIR